MKSPSGLLAAAVLVVAVPAFAQSSTQSSTTPTLSELAKKAQEKKGTTPAIKTFTNEDLKKSSPSPSDDVSGADAKSDSAKDSGKSTDAKTGDATQKGAAAEKDDAKKDDPSKADAPKTEKYWRERMDAAREDLRRNQSFAAALQSRINALTADFSARDDPYQRAQIADERQKALAELDRVNKAIEDGNKAVAAIEEEARKAMVPAGWIR